MVIAAAVIAPFATVIGLRLAFGALARVVR